jgi:transcriptional regulator with XRE-family HTH domain
VGIGTVLYALALGPIAQYCLPRFAYRSTPEPPYPRAALPSRRLTLAPPRSSAEPEPLLGQSLSSMTEVLRYGGWMRVAANGDQVLVQLGDRLRELRRARALSLESLAATSGVSRSMISDVERGVRSPTVLVLARLATALGTTVSRLLGEDQPARTILIRHAEQHAIDHPDGWQRRIVSPVLPGVEFEFIRTSVAADTVIGAFAAHAAGSREYVAVESGELTVTLDGADYRLGTGDALYYAADCIHAFANPGPVQCVYYTAMQIVGAPHHP